MKKLEINSLSKMYIGARSVLNNVSFSLDDNEFLVVIGQSGCGKSTLLKCIAGLENYQTGDIILNNKNLNELSNKERKISMIFQNYYLYPHYTIYQNLAFVLLNQKLSRDEIDLRINKIASKFEISHLLAERPRSLSGGQRQKVALARMMLKNSDIVLLDEPLANIDEKYRESFMEELKAFHKKSETPFIYVTHNHNEALKLSSKVMLILEGRISSLIDVKDIYSNPNNLDIIEFFSKYGFNKFNAEVIDNTHVLFNNKIIEVEYMSNIYKGQEVILGINSDSLSIGDKGTLMKVLYSNPIDNRYIIELIYNDDKYYVLSDKLYFRDDEVLVNLDNLNYFVFDKKHGNKISGITKETYIKLDYKYLNDSIELKFLNTKYILEKEYLDYILPFKNNVYLKIFDYNFNNEKGIKLIGKVDKIVDDYIYVLFNDYGFYFKHNNEIVGDDYVTYLDFDALSFIDEENNILSIACPISDNIDKNNKKVNDFIYSNKKEKGFNKIYPIYEELIGNKVVSFFKVKNDKNVFMDILDKDKSIYSKEYRYLKFKY